MVDKIANDARVYTDIQGLENLRYEAGRNTGAVKKEISHQFEAMLMQIVMRSMRDANKSLASDLFGSSGDEMDFYQDMFDKQLSMMTSSTGNSFAQMVEKNIDLQYPNVKTTADAQTAEQASPVVSNSLTPLSSGVPYPASKHDLAEKSEMNPVKSTRDDSKKTETAIHTPEDFVKKLWSSAKAAASSLGVDPRILLAQAALETNWGRKILPQNKDTSSHNLFNIKADTSWTKQTTTKATLEQQDGVNAKVKATFRSYASYAESFKDYVSFLKQNSRYSEALSKATDPQQFVTALQKAGFATDNDYAEKILKIFSSNMFKRLTEKFD